MRLTWVERGGQEGFQAGAIACARALWSEGADTLANVFGEEGGEAQGHPGRAVQATGRGVAFVTGRKGISSE